MCIRDSSLPTAASGTLGGIKVGTNLSIDENGVLSSTDTNTTYSVGDGGLTENDFTTTLKNKLDGITAGAEVNVQSDWNASSGDALILNKPTIPSGNQIIDWTEDHATEVIHANNYTNTTYNNATTNAAGLMLSLIHI